MNGKGFCCTIERASKNFVLQLICAAVTLFAPVQARSEEGILSQLWDGVGSATSGIVGGSLSEGQRVLSSSYAEVADISPLLSQLGFHLDTVEFSASIFVLDSGATLTFSSDTASVDEQAVQTLKARYSNDTAKRLVIWTAVAAKEAEQTLGFRSVMLRLKIGLHLRAQFCLVNAEANRIWPCQ